MIFGEETWIFYSPLPDFWEEKCFLDIRQKLDNIEMETISKDPAINHKFVTLTFEGQK